MTNQTTKCLPNDEKGVALVIGNLDGVHKGHQALVRYTVELAQRRGLQAKAMTFEPHPAKLLVGQSPGLLTKLERKLVLLHRIAPELSVIVQPFDRDFANLMPREFVERILVSWVHVREVVVGANFRFGRDRLGSSEDFVRLGAELGFSSHAFALSNDSAGTISSSRIRKLVESGELSAASELLGRPHAISGLIVRGDGRGRTLGFATANLENVEELLPPHGVYAAVAELVQDGGQVTPCPAAVHLGPRLTVDRGATIEAHLIGRSGEFYGQWLRLHLLSRLRGIERFSGIEALQAQIRIDVEQTLSIAARALETPFLQR